MARVSNSTLALFFLLLTAIFAAPCSDPNYPGTVYSAKITASLDGGLIPFSEQRDSQCFNYSLPYSFNKVPTVAIAVHDFEAEPSNSIYFFIKPILTDSLNFIPIVIRTQWTYTQWTHITFSLIAEDRDDIFTGYHQVDSGLLSTCSSEKQLVAFIPIHHNYNPNQLKHSVFLHGFEISSIKNNDGSKTPFELQIFGSQAKKGGIEILLTVTTNTQVNSIYISFLAFQKTSLQIVGGHFVFDAAVQKLDSGLFYSPEALIPRNFARLYGLTGFLLNYNKERIIYSTSWDGSIFNFKFGNRIQDLKYFSFGYVFFVGSLCLDCPSMPIEHQGACVSFCPIGTYETAEKTCVSCGEGKQWNGTNCVITCTRGQYLNTLTNLCECPPSLNWNGQSCIPCENGKIWQSQSKSCQCPNGLTWNGYSCAKLDNCKNGKVWDFFTFSCQCPDNTFWDGEKCKELTECLGGQIRNDKFQCVCPEGYIWSSNSCIYSPCFGGQVWTGSKCVCPVGLNYNGSMCLQCINGQKWDSKTSTCSCQIGYKWNGQYCEKSYICGNGRVWSPTYLQCICPQGHYWNGYNCVINQKCTGGQYFDTSIQKCLCLSGFQWDGKNCIQCSNGKIWNVTTLSCTCPFGSSQFKGGCKFEQKCSGGKQWNQNSWSCQCPGLSTWDGNNCILNRCQNGQIWNDTLKSCQCPGGKVVVNQTCVPPQIVCTNGRVWNQFIYACSCPPGKFSTPTSCENIPSCTSGKVYNPLNNQCQCPFGLIEKNGICADAKCPQGQAWNNYKCQVINCPPSTYFSNGQCISGGQNKCDFGYYYNGKECIYSPLSCPSGTVWSGFNCENKGKCGNGYYQLSGNCILLQQKCPNGFRWQGNRCVSPDNICPKGTYSQNKKCFPFEQCKNGFVWDPNYLRCICPPGTINNDNRCVQCGNGKLWTPQLGCACPQGSFDIGSSCQSFTNQKCLSIANAIWSNNKCQCRPGFTKVGFQCICYGTQNGDFCDKCSYKPNSKLVPITNTCECKQGYIQIRQACLLKGSVSGRDDPTKCSVSTYFDENHKSCLPCPAGCLSCFDCYRCKICSPGFSYDPISQKCFEKCGDGKKFTLQCDDGNNYDGDGCSKDCKVQSGYTCTGGSSENKDNCNVFKPERVKIQQIGLIRRSTSIVLNVRLNYLPNSLLQAQQCNNKCNVVLQHSITQGDKNPLSISSQYLAGTRYVFSITIQFGRPYIGKFKINVSVSNSVLKYFGGVGVQPLDISVQPSYLMSTASSDILG